MTHQNPNGIALILTTDGRFSTDSGELWYAYKDAIAMPEMKKLMNNINEV